MLGRVMGRAAMAAALLLAACSTPEPNRGAEEAGDLPAERPSAPDAGEGSAGARQDAALTGRIVGPDGSPRPGVAVTVVERGSSAGFDAAITAIFTLGIACVASPNACSPGGRVMGSGETDADGRYRVVLPQAYLPGFETDEDWVLQVGRAPAGDEVTGPASSFELEVNTAVQEAPDLPLWDGSPTITATGPLLQVALPPLRAGLEDRFPRFVDDAGAPVWELGGDTVDPRVLEDRPLRLLSSATADVTVPHDDGRTIYHQHVATAAVPYQGSLVPLSRAKPCASTSGALVGCWATDGDLSAETTLGVDQALTIDLGAAAEVGLVVVRGTPAQEGAELTVEVSADGATWSVLPDRRLDGARGWSAGAPPGGGVPSPRYVRVTTPRDHALAEVSVWPPTDSERLAAAPPSARRSAGADGDVVPWGHGMAAGAAVLAAGALLVVSRRRGRI